MFPSLILIELWIYFDLFYMLLLLALLAVIEERNDV